MKILIKDCLILTDNRDQVDRGDIAIEGDRLIAVGADGEAPVGWQPDLVIDGRDRLCLPGLINCHTHVGMTLLRGFADDLPLMEWLALNWPVEHRMTGEDVYWSTLLAIIEMVKSGTTTFNDQYIFMGDVARAVDETGMRAVLAHGMSGVGQSAERRPRREPQPARHAGRVAPVAE
jgi:5-methylthioadenosine/S-adenosylhomocysteine deaminase